MGKAATAMESPMMPIGRLATESAKLKRVREPTAREVARNVSMKRLI